MFYQTDKEREATYGKHPKTYAEHIRLALKEGRKAALQKRRCSV